MSKSKDFEALRKDDSDGTPFEYPNAAITSFVLNNRNLIARGLRMQASIEDPRTKFLVRGLARRLAQTPHTGDEEQDTATYNVVLSDALDGFLGVMK